MINNLYLCTHYDDTFIKIVRDVFDTMPLI
jgi:hypothetical protein